MFYVKHRPAIGATLSIVFDDCLSWNKQIRQLISRAGKRMGMLSRLRRSLTRESANVVYCSLIRPILEYCVSVCRCCKEGHKNGLEALQNRAARIVARTVCSNPGTDVLKWPTLVERCHKTVFKLIKKCLQGQGHGQCPQYYDLSITMGALFLMNYLDGISYSFTSKFFICTKFSIYISISVSVMQMYTIVLVHYCAQGSH